METEQKFETVVDLIGKSSNKIKSCDQKAGRLYARSIFIGFRRGLRNQHEATSLLRVEGCDNKKDARYYIGKHCFYLYRGPMRTLKNGRKTRARLIKGKIVNAHGNSGVVRARFKKNLPASAMGNRVRVNLLGMIGGRILEFLIYLVFIGPSIWGIANPEWKMCSNGKFQSPINIDLNRVVYDASLPNLNIKINIKDYTSELYNNGRHIVVNLNDYMTLERASNYNYASQSLTFFFGKDNDFGSQHSINQHFMPGELNVNYSQELNTIYSNLDKVRFVGRKHEIKVTLDDIITSDSDYLTYNGSKTVPDCAEGVEWIILNNPIFITSEYMEKLRLCIKGDPNNNKLSLQDNIRPIQKTNNRVILSNIQPDSVIAQNINAS
ncbi:60S ribosomal protein L35a [Intoshia linei]|uniref:Large ribosomal subunit protein eL33 n=1 Tax=Intoshia linei TaxID=1819745 RepID=A0A177B5B4_9BILA|nr:60S ribosomal protein L35a [Intoshia linei]